MNNPKTETIETLELAIKMAEFTIELQQRLIRAQGEELIVLRRITSG